MTPNTRKLGLGAALLLAAAGLAHAHGDVLPQPVNTETLPNVGEEWLIENPYRAETAGPEVWAEALRVGASGYTQNCARCHGLEAISGGTAPDLRFLEAEEYGDEWYVERFRAGYTQGGVSKMPAFEGVLDQKAAWAIRTYIETRPDDQDMAALSDELKAIRDDLAGWAESGAAADAGPVAARLAEIAAGVGTLSGAPVADSVAFRAANILTESPTAYKEAAETLSIGLSVAR